MQIKLITVLLTVFMLHLSAKTVSQTVTLTGTNLKLENVLAAIERQTGYTALYKEADLKHAAPVSITAAGLPLMAFLDSVFTGQPLAYTIRRTTIFIRYKPLENIKKEAEVPVELPPLKGRVIDSTGRVLQGVSVYIMRGGKFMGLALTDGKGEFSIATEIKNGDVLSFSFVGFETRTINVGERSTFLDVVMKQVAKDLNAIEVTSVNTGYQRIKPEQSTGAVSRITTKEYESRISTDFLSGLVNKLPGLMINNDVKFNSSLNGGTPTSNSLFNVRGISTITGNQNPLIVVDGYPTELTLNMINPNEIESVTILKDAAAATVYGVRASNGVIVIERKQAVAGKARFEFRTTGSITPKENYTRYRWAPDASGINVAYNRDRYKTSVDSNSWSNMLKATGSAQIPVYYVMAQQASRAISPYQAATQFKEMSGYNNAADYGRLFLRSTVTQTHNLDISGGSPGALYYITANYTGNRLQQLNNNNSQFLLSGRTTLSLSKRLSLILTTDYLEAKSMAAPVPDINSLHPYERLQDATGAPLPVFTGSLVNPYYNDVLQSKGLLDNLYYPLVDVDEVSNKSRQANNRITADFTYKVGHGISFRFGGIYENSRSDLKHYATEKSSEARQYVNTYTQQGASGLVFNIPRGGFLQQQTSSTSSYTLRAQVNYDRRLGNDHSVNGILGMEVRDVVDQLSSAAYFGYNDQTLLQQPVNYSLIATGFSSTFVPARSINYTSLFNQAYTDNRYVSGFSNIVYTFKNRYSISASARLDQSNLFGTNPKYRYKPLWSVGANWNIYKEEFMRKLPWVKMLNLRLSEGINGNVAKMALPQVIAKAIANSYTLPVSTALTRYAYANSALRWEQTSNFNAGLDFSIFTGISGSVDYYNKKSTDLLANGPINPSLGTITYINTASINNQGLEFKLQADWITHPGFNWNTGFVMARNTSKVLKVYQNLTLYPPNVNGAGYLEGYPLGPVFAYRWAGIDNTGIPLVQDDKGKVYSTTATGVSTMMTTNGKTSGLVTYMGTSIPAVNGGLSNRIDIGSFYFYCMINYYGGFKVMVPRPDPTAVRPLAGSGSYWKQPGDELHSDVMSLAGFANTYARYAYNFADAYTVNGDYITIGDLTASYNLANSFAAFKRAGFTRFDLKLQASNVYTRGLNKYNFSKATGSYAKSYLTPTYTVGLFTNF